MEKLLTTEDRIRRAEEIYERRKNRQVRMNTATVNVNNKKNFKLLKKVLLQILACSIIYYLFLGGHNIIDFSSQENLDKLKLLVNNDADFSKIYQDIKGKFVINNEKQEEKVQENTVENNNQVLEEATLSITENAVEVANEETAEQEMPELTQDEIDANTIKQKYALIKPVEGVISSKFGQRESDNSIVSSNHLGIDIAADEGTKIVAAMEGTVTIAKYSDSYRELFKNRK